MAVKFSNNASSTLASAITSGSTTIALATGQGALFPTLSGSAFFFATLVDSSNNLEIVKVTARTGDSLTVTRAQGGTSARAFSAGDKCELRVVAGALDEFLQRDGSVTPTANLPMAGYKLTGAAQGTASGEPVTAERSISTSANLTGGGNLTADRTLDLSDTGVTAGQFGSATAIPIITVDAKGRITARSTAALDLSTKVDLGGGNATAGSTWNINVSGNAGSASSVAWGNVSGKPSLATADTNLGAGGIRYLGNCSNCGNINCWANCTFAWWEVYNAGGGVHQTREAQYNRQSWNCNCQCK